MPSSVPQNNFRDLPTLDGWDVAGNHKAAQRISSAEVLKEVQLDLVHAVLRANVEVHQLTVPNPVVAAESYVKARLSLKGEDFHREFLADFPPSGDIQRDRDQALCILTAAYRVEAVKPLQGVPLEKLEAGLLKIFETEGLNLDLAAAFGKVQSGKGYWMDSRQFVMDLLTSEFQSERVTKEMIAYLVRASRVIPS
jgi:hypothetical protein